MTRVTPWVLGSVLGLAAGGSILSLGVLALIIGVPAIVWAGTERRRPVGLAGFLVGAGLAIGGLPAMAAARCSAVGDVGGDIVESCTSPDVTPYIAAGLALAITGAVLTVAVALRPRLAPGA